MFSFLNQQAVDWMLTRAVQMTQVKYVAMVTFPGCCTDWRQRMLGSIWSLAAAARHPPDTTGTEADR